MTTWKQALREGLVSGTVAAVLSATYMAWRGQQRGTPAAPINAVSHWLFGDESLERDEPSVRHTLTGFAVHHGAAIFWGVLHARFWGARPEAKRPLPALAGGLAASAVACFVDYQLTPRRLQPGYENRLSHRELTGVYAWFGVGLAAGSLLMRRSQQRERERQLQRQEVHAMHAEQALRPVVPADPLEPIGFMPESRR